MADDELHRQKCDTIFRNLLIARDSPDLLASIYVAGFFDTCRCDDVFDMRPHRRELEAKINKDDPTRLARILALDTTTKDEACATLAIMHYRTWHDKKLSEALSWPTWLKYNVIDRSERTVAMLGITGAGIGGWKAVQRSFQFLREAQRRALPAAASMLTSVPAPAANGSVAIAKPGAGAGPLT